MLPLAGKFGMEWQFNRTHNPWSTAIWHEDACCHPPPKGHLMLNLVLAYCMVQEEHDLLSGWTANDDNQRDYLDITLNDAYLREPIYVSPEEEELYVRNTVEDATFIDFTDPNGETKWKGLVKENSGWEWFADNADHDKFGFITSFDEGEPPHIALALRGGKYGMIEVSHVVSYENFGVCLVWIDDSTTNLKDKECNTTYSQEMHYEERLPFDKVMGYWDEKASVPSARLLNQKLESGKNATLHVCLTPRNARLVKGTENKFKLLSVRVY